MMLRCAWLVASKDLRIELRSRVLLWQVLPFGVIALVLSALAVGPSTAAMRHAAPGLFYLVMLLVALLSIGRSENIESPTGTRTSVRMLGLDPAGVFLGKSLALLIELAVSATVLLAGIVLLFHARALGVIEATPSVLLALAAIAASGTLYGVLVGDSRVQSTLLPVVALPPLAGVLIVGERAMGAALTGNASLKWVVFLGSALAAYAAIGMLLYGVAEESS